MSHPPSRDVFNQVPVNPITDASEAFWNSQGYRIEVTADGSPTLALLEGESMHHRGGAFSETLLVYGRALDWGIQQGLQVVASVGLGLGYNEILSVCKYHQAGNLNGLRLLSFESQEVLIQNFLRWVRTGETEGSEFSSSLPRIGEESFATDQIPGIGAQIYEDICRFFEGDFGLTSFQIRKALQLKAEEGDWQILGSLGPEVFHSKDSGQGNFKQSPVEIWLYDAFSSKTSPELWSQDFLEDLFQNHTALQSVLSTYACTGNLKRALENSGFCFSKEPGFMGKRNSSFATRKALG